MNSVLNYTKFYENINLLQFFEAVMKKYGGKIKNIKKKDENHYIVQFDNPRTNKTEYIHIVYSEKFQKWIYFNPKKFNDDGNIFDLIQRFESLPPAIKNEKDPRIKELEKRKFQTNKINEILKENPNLIDKQNVKKNIDLRQFFADLGAIQVGRGLFHTPWREDRNPSLGVFQLDRGSHAVEWRWHDMAKHEMDDIFEAMSKLQDKLNTNQKASNLSDIFIQILNVIENKLKIKDSEIEKQLEVIRKAKKHIKYTNRNNQIQDNQPQKYQKPNFIPTTIQAQIQKVMQYAIQREIPEFVIEGLQTLGLIGAFAAGKILAFGVKNIRNHWHLRIIDDSYPIQKMLLPGGEQDITYFSIDPNPLKKQKVSQGIYPRVYITEGIFDAMPTLM